MDPLPPDSARQIDDDQDDERRIDVYVRVIVDDEPGGAGLKAGDEPTPRARPRRRQPR